MKVRIMENFKKKTFHVCEKEEAIQAIENEIGDVRMELLLLEEKLKNTYFFNNLHLLGIIESEIDKIPRDSNGQYTEEILLSAYQDYYRFQVPEENDNIDS
jgi:hypothetical protein